MAKFIFEMPDELAARVEAWRGDHRLKFTADAVRQLIERGLGGDPAPAMAAPTPKPPSFSHGRSGTVVAETRRRRVDVVAPKRDRIELAAAVAVDALTGTPIKPRGALQKGGKR